MCAADTTRFIDNSDGTQRRRLLCQWDGLPAKQVGEPANGEVAARRAEINGRLTIDNSRREWSATRIATLCTLRLWKKIIDLLYEVAVA